MARPGGSGSLLTELPSGTLTFLLSDIEQSTQGWDQHPAEMSRALEIHDAIFEASVRGHDGNLVELGREGDSILCVFARPSDAIACAVDMQLELLHASWPAGTELRVRMALHTGEAELRDGHYFGPAVYRCARLLTLSHGGQTILSGPTRDLVVDSLPESVSFLELGVHRLRDLARPERVFQLTHPELRSDFPALTSVDGRPTNLPVELTSFLGRESELGELKRLLGRSRLVTISGAGGLGKTRIALRLAGELVPSYPDGVWLVELASLSDPALVTQAVATSAGVRERPGTPLRQTLTEHLQPRTCLLVLDNCEHLIAECAALSDHLLAKCPNLSLLATSRERIGTSGEQLWRLGPLALPPVPGRLPAPQLLESDAVRLFVERAWPKSPRPEIDARRAAAIVQICRRLDGIPLAIELAAARARVMTVEEMLERLDDRFRLLTGGARTAGARQQTLRAAVDWSHQLLEPGERKLFARLSVFAGGFSVADVEAVCAGDGVERGDVIELLAHLVDKSLAIPVEEGDQERPMRMLETLQQYARERLREAGEAEVYLRRHAEHFLQLAIGVEDQADGGETWIDRLENAHDNFRAALEWSQTDSAELNLRLAAVLLGLWDTRGYLTEGRDALARALAAWPEPTALRAEALGAAGWLAQRLGDFDGAAADFEEAVRIGRDTQRRDVLAWSLRNLGLVRLLQGDGKRAGELARDALAIAEDLQDPKAVGGSLLVLALVAYFRGDHEQAGAHADRSLALHRTLGDEKVVAFLLACLATLALDHHDPERARAGLRESLEISRELGEKVDVAFVLETCARLAAASTQPARALKLAGAAAAVRGSVGALPAPPWARLVEGALAPARVALGAKAAQAAWSEGQALSLAEAIDFALGERRPGRSST